MKSVSDCPVCKVPFHRREVRPTPHMDNLVSIYKGMEVAAGVNIFTTQIGHMVKKSDAQLPDNVEGSCDAAKTSIATHQKSKRYRLSKKKKELNKADAGSNSSSSMMPSFPAKKRVLVTPYPPTETPIRPQRVIKSANPSTQSEAIQIFNKNNDNHKPSDPVFSPFFWLRERNEGVDDDDSDKHTTQHTADVSPFNVLPCFSDIKDSDDEDQMKNTPLSKLDAPGLYDSEMFEWTQRACSPELCSTPLKDQICMDSLDGIEDKEHQKYLPVGKSGEILAVGAKRKCLKKKRSNAKKKKKNANEIRISISEAASHLLPVDSLDIAKNSSSEDLENNKFLNQGKKACKKLSKESSNYNKKHTMKSVKKQAAEQPLPIIAEVKHHSIGNETSELLHASSILETENDQAGGKENDPSSAKQKAKIRSQRKNMKSSKLPVMEAPDLLPSKGDTGEAFKDEDNQEANANLLAFPNNHGENGEAIRKRKPERVKEIQQEGKMKKPRRVDHNNAKDANIMPLASMSTGDIKNCLTTTSFGPESESMSINGTKTTGAALFRTSDAIMRKCGNIPSKIQCSFCQSDNDTEVSGEMMHYFNGKPVTADHNGALNIIHAHKNCTEWAPDVYFEDEVAINLVAEVGRSKRIKCSCCSIKGAALGCFDRSCRKSFHFTCAKLIPECRWDIENFVMLCPLHSSSKLPIEVSEPQKKCRKGTAPREPQTLSRSNYESKGLKWKWPSGSPFKWVLCCSALTNDEKETVSKFAKLVGASVLKSWTPTVTHVIASTDENGASRRTLKFLMAIIHGKWILSINWIKDCMEAMEPVDEEKYEIKADVNGIRDGPRLGRVRAISKKQKLFDSMKFYLNGAFTASYKGYLQELINAAGGVVLQRKPISRDKERLLDGSHLQVTYIIYSSEISDMHQSNRESVISSRRDEAQVLADATGAKVASNTWIIDSIAACELQKLN